MDAASNNGVDNIRDIRDEVVYSPSVLKYRVYIVDEVHMLSGSAFNALLKTLEEPPAHAVFILATTELHKLPSTIVSRCQRYDFRRISTDTIVERLELISKKEGIEYSRDALRIIAKMAQGGMRDAISLLELCSGNKEKITAELVNETLGVGGRENAEKTVRAIADKDFDGIFSAIDTVVRSSKDVSVFWQDLISFYRDMLVIKTTRQAQEYLDLTDDEVDRLTAVAALFSKETLIYHCRVLDDTFQTMQKAVYAKRTVAEMALVKMCDESLQTSQEALLSRISKLETAIAMGMALPSVAITPMVEVKSEKERAPETVKPSANQETATKTEEFVTKANTEQARLKILRGWNEITEQASVGDGPVKGFLKTAKAFVDADGKIHVRFQNELSKSMAETPRIKEAISAAVRMTTQRNVTSEDVIFEIVQGDEDNCSDLDELNFD